MDEDYMRNRSLIVSSAQSIDLDEFSMVVLYHELKAVVENISTVFSHIQFVREFW